MNDRNIGVQFDQVALALGGLASDGASITLPEVSFSYNSNTDGFAYFPEVYSEFCDILRNYRALLSRDITMTSDMIGCFIAYDQQALQDRRSSSQNFSAAPCPTPTPSANSDLIVTSVDLGDGDPIQNSFETTSFGSDDYHIDLSDLDDMCAEIINDLTSLMSSCETFSSTIQNFYDSEGFYGLTATALKDYWLNVHGACVVKIYTAATTFLDNISAYWLSYSDSSVLQASLPFALLKNELDSVKSDLSLFDSDFSLLHDEVVAAINAVATGTSGAYSYSSYTPNYDALSTKVLDTVDYIDSINSEVVSNEDNVESSYSAIINESISDLNEYLNSIILNVNQDNITNQNNGVPCVIEDSYVAVTESVSTDVAIHSFYSDVANEGIQRAQSVAVQDELDSRRSQVEFEIVSDVVVICFCVATMVGTGGLDTPGAIPVIVESANGIATVLAASDLYEDGGTYYYIQQGDLDSYGTNIIYEGCFAPIGVDRETYNVGERCIFFLAATSGTVARIPYSPSTYASNVTRVVVSAGAGEIAGNCAYNVALDNGASPMQAMMIGMVASAGTSWSVDSLMRSQTVPTIQSQSYPDSLSHAVSSPGAAQSVADGINPDYFNADSRFGAGMYLGDDEATLIAELNHHGNTAQYAVNFDVDLSGQNVLDLTNPTVAEQWGFVPDDSICDTSFCQELARQAQDEGYNVIMAPSYRGSGTNYIIYSNFEDILSPTSIVPINN